MTALRCRPGDVAMVTRCHQGYRDGATLPWLKLYGVIVTVVAIEDGITWRIAEPIVTPAGNVTLIDDSVLTPYRPWERQSEASRTDNPLNVEA